MSFPLPNSYTEWRHCITEICGIPLGESFIRERLETDKRLVYPDTERPRGKE